jgi:Flp pilus assembly pilin Flp
MKKFVTRLVRDDSGVTAIEYALIAAPISVVGASRLATAELNCIAEQR